MSNSESVKNKRLRTVFVLVRHGSRTPCHPQFCFDVEFKNELVQHPPHTITPIQVINQKDQNDRKEKFSEATYDGVYLNGGQCKPGQLVGKGAQGQYLVGEMLRHRYMEEEKLLQADYDSHDVFVQSSHIQRTIESARSLLAGMYPQQSSSQSLPIYVSKPTENLALPINPYLPYIGRVLRENPSLIPGMQNAVNEAKKFLSIGGVLDLSYLWDNLKTLKELDMLPELPQRIWDLCSNWGPKWFEMRSLGTDKCRFITFQISSGMLIDFILNKISDLKNETHVHKLHVITGHDSTLWSLMHILKAKGIESPPTTNSTLVLEFYEKENTSNIIVNVVFNNEKQLLEGKENFDLTMQEFLSLVEKYRVNKEECQQLRDDFEPKIDSIF